MLGNLFDTGYFTYATNIAKNIDEASVSSETLASENLIEI